MQMRKAGVLSEVRGAACLLGLSLVISLSTSYSLSIRLAVTVDALQNLSWITNVARVVTFLLVALLSSRVTALARHPSVPWVAAASVVAAMCLTTLVGSLGDAGTVFRPRPNVAMLLGCLGLTLNGVGYALLYMCWLELYARMDQLHVVAFFSLAHLLSATISLAVFVLPIRAAAVVCIVAMPIASAALYRQSLRAFSDSPFMRGERPISGWSLPAMPIALLFSFTFANSFVRHFLEDELKALVLVGVIAAALLVLVVLVSTGDRFDLRMPYNLSLPLIVAASLCILVGMPGFGTAGGMLSNAAYALFSIFTTVLLCNISYRDGVNALWLFGFACAAVSLGSIASGALSTVVDSHDSGQPIITLIISAVILVFVSIYAIFSGHGDSARAWGIKRQSGAPGAASATGMDINEMQERCARLARRFGLTRREEEIMALLARGDTYAQIEGLLAISNSTLKTHARHIYAKTGAPDRDGLAKLVRG